MEDYTWEKEADVIGNGDDDGANELVDEYWNRVAYLESRRHLVTERTAETLRWKRKEEGGSRKEEGERRKEE